MTGTSCCVSPEGNSPLLIAVGIVPFFFSGRSRPEMCLIWCLQFVGIRVVSLMIFSISFQNQWKIHFALMKSNKMITTKLCAWCDSCAVAKDFHEWRKSWVKNHWQIISWVTKKWLFTVTNVLFYFFHAILHNAAENNHLSLILPSSPRTVFSDLALWCHSQLVCNITQTWGTSILKSYSVSTKVIFASELISHHPVFSAWRVRKLQLFLVDDLDLFILNSVYYRRWWPVYTKRGPEGHCEWGPWNELIGAKPLPESMLTYCQLDP